MLKRERREEEEEEEEEQEEEQVEDNQEDEVDQDDEDENEAPRKDEEELEGDEDSEEEEGGLDSAVLDRDSAYKLNMYKKARCDQHGEIATHKWYLRVTRTRICFPLLSFCSLFALPLLCLLSAFSLLSVSFSTHVISFLQVSQLPQE
jgi:hypothetical protein